MLDLTPETAQEAVPARHPLDPLTAAEIERAAALVRAATDHRETLRFTSIALHENSRGVPEGTAVPRTAFCVAYDRAEKLTYEAVVDLDAGTVELTPVPNSQPALTYEEFELAERLTREDPRWQAAMRLRGVEDLSLAMIDPWPAGYTGPADDPEHGRICRPLTFVRSSPEDNGYARPVEGLISVVDLDARVVRDVIDHGVVPLPPLPGNWETDLMAADPENLPYVPQARTDERPISITQPEGASFRVDGWAVEWQKWSMRLGFTPREGLVIHDLAYTDGGRKRPLFHRMSLSEMMVPYGDPNPTHFNKNVFDEGEYGMGTMANSLALGCDCLGEIYYFDAVLNDAEGNAVPMPNAICMHEEDVGVTVKHTDFRTGRGEVRRGRRLVVSFFATVGNYDYGFFWYFYNDASIEFEVKLNGIMSVGAVPEGETPKYGTLIAPGLYAPNHQHFFSVRLDACLDGGTNSVYEVDTVAIPRGEENPHGNAWMATGTLLETEQQAQRLIDPLAGRSWKIVNPSSTNRMGQPVGYKLIPMENALPFLTTDSWAGRRAGFAYKHLWVTAYDPKERYAAGDYPWQNSGGLGLPAFTADDAPVADTDVVVWYTMGHNHVARLEDWPVMPCARMSFWLKPVGFFDANPALDLPKPVAACHSGCGCAAGSCTCH